MGIRIKKMHFEDRIVSGIFESRARFRFNIMIPQLPSTSSVST